MPSLSICSTSLLALLFASACGGSTHTPGDKAYSVAVAPGTRAPAGALEEQILATLPTMAPEQPTQMEGQTITASAPYNAASGQQCRRISISSAQQTRPMLACLLPRGWSFVPTIFPEEARPL